MFLIFCKDIQFERICFPLTMFPTYNLFTFPFTIALFSMQSFPSVEINWPMQCRFKKTQKRKIPCSWYIGEFWKRENPGDRYHFFGFSVKFFAHNQFSLHCVLRQLCQRFCWSCSVIAQIFNKHLQMSYFMSISSYQFTHIFQMFFWPEK